jgi:hypothetical protein
MRPHVPDDFETRLRLLMAYRALAVAVAVDEVFKNFPDADTLNQFLNMPRAQGPDGP